MLRCSHTVEHVDSAYIIGYVCCFIVPTPNVTVTAPNTQIVGQSLTLECNVTAVRGVTSRVDIVWSRDYNIMLRRTNNTTPIMMDNSLVYTDNYTIQLLNTNDDNRNYFCEVVINASPVVMATGNTRLNVTGE